MAVPKSQEFLLSGCFIMSVLLQGCGGKPLSEREIVRGIFFEKQGANYSVCLLITGQNADEAQNDYTTVSAEGTTAASALSQAEKHLQGNVYYGLADLAAFPAETDYDEALALGRLLYEKVQPAPELSIFVLPRHLSVNWSKDTAGLYDRMKAAEKKWKIHSGLQQLFVQENVCLLPVYAPNGYSLALLSNNQIRKRIVQGLPAGLAALLAGLGKELNGTFANDTAGCRATASVTSNGAALCLCLRNASLQDFGGTREETELRKLLRIELRAIFSALVSQHSASGYDPFYFVFRQKCLYGADTEFCAPTIEIVFE